MKLSLIIFFLITFTVCAQNQRSEPQDSTLGLLRIEDPSLLLQKPAFVLPFSHVLIVGGKSSRLPLYQSFAGVPQSFAWDRPAQIDLTAPLMLQLYAAEQERPWRVTLGAASTAGALYIAYKHLKKYGFK
ncbi:MAG: hypothetical protein WCW40_08060 [Bacteroidota bacterium]